MRFCQKSLWLGVGLVILVLGFSGCVTTPSLRMPAVLGLPLDKKVTHVRELRQWPKHQRFGLVTLSDTTGPKAAPAISSTMLSRLSQRIHVNLEKRCAGPEINDIPITDLQMNYGLSSLLEVAKGHDVESLIIALFSSTETTQANTFGEERMMTQMPGTTTHNWALVELGLLDVEQGIVVIQANGEATESLDRLMVPIGTDQPTREEALDILRANAGQQALDVALQDFMQGCVSS